MTVSSQLEIITFHFPPELSWFDRSQPASAANRGLPVGMRKWELWGLKLQLKKIKSDLGDAAHFIPAPILRAAETGAASTRNSCAKGGANSVDVFDTKYNCAVYEINEKVRRLF